MLDIQPRDHTPLVHVNRQKAQQVIEKLVEHWKNAYPQEAKQFTEFMLQNRRIGDNFSQKRALRRSAEVPTRLYHWIGKALEDTSWQSKRGYYDLFKQALPIAVYPTKDKGNALIMTEEMKNAVGPKTGQEAVVSLHNEGREDANPDAGECSADS